MPVITTVVLCGGRGTRAYPHTIEVPKPLLEVGGRPVLDHVLRVYAEQGLSRFVLAAGYKQELLVRYAEGTPDAWSVDVVDTGDDTGTGGRLWRTRAMVSDPFFATYADGLGDVDLNALLAFHRAHPGAATLTSVPLPSPYGTLELRDDGRVDRFQEKPRLAGHRINAGFFAFDRRVFEQWAGDDLEREVLPALAAAGELYAYPHDGFWRSMDTYKEAVELSELCLGGDPPWLGQSTPGQSRASSS